MHILIADPDPLSRRAFGLLLKRKLEVCEIIEADDMETLALKIAEIPPELLLLDWKLNCASPIETSILLRSTYPGMKIILLSLNPDDAGLAHDTGAEFVHKGASPKRLLSVLENLFPDQFSA